ncbi:MAG: relaxase/mobilization nuclease domain-containing protein, partial [Myxococcales bacterium]|nr:relaxase/mobilization nuclease domain-containing protein [Myxococcales bacterium]
PVFHCALSLPPGEQLGKRQWVEVVHKFMKGMGFDGAPFVAVAHHDTEHPHVHIVASRVRRDRSLVSDSYDFPRAELLMRQFERDFQLREVPCSWEIEGKSPTQERFHHAKRSLQKDAREHLIEGVAEALAGKAPLCFERALDAKQITRAWRTDEKTGQIRGVSFCFQGVQLSGSTLDKSCSWPRIARTMGLDRHLTPANYDERLRDARLSEQLTQERRSLLRQRLHARAQAPSAPSLRDEHTMRVPSPQVQDAPVARAAQVREQIQGVRPPEAVEKPQREVTIHDVSHMSLEAYTAQYTREKPQSPMAPLRQNQEVSGQVGWSDVLCREGRFTPVREASGAIKLVAYDASFEVWRGEQARFVRPFGRAVYVEAAAPRAEVQLIERPNRTLAEHLELARIHAPQHSYRALGEGERVRGTLLAQDLLMKDGRFTLIHISPSHTTIAPYDPSFETHRGVKVSVSRS